MDPTRNPNSDQNHPFTDDDEHRVPPNEPPIEAEELDNRDTMFEKPLTPSDVGKLNRLVIPKHHAERHFPLGGGDSTGMQLGFEDEAGQSWWFRYSYWNSSQSYVLTRGWRRYVKEKRLHAGDVVLFERHRSQPDRLFINWRRRGAAPPRPLPTCSPALAHLVGLPGYQQHYQSTGEGQAREEEKATAVGSACTCNKNSKRLVRLFGVNLECQHNNSFQTTSSTSTQKAYHNYFS